MDFTLLKEFLKPELIVVAIVLYFIGNWLKALKSIKDEYIPIILGVLGIVVAAIYVFATTTVASTQEIFLAIFVAVTQGVLCAGASVYVDQLLKQAQKLKE